MMVHKLNESSKPLETGHLEKADDVADVIFKSKINHPVSFIHTEVFAVVECKSFLFEHVDQTTWSCNNYMNSFAQNVALLAHRDAPYTEKRVELREFAFPSQGWTPGIHVLVGLVGKFTRWTQNDANRSLATDEWKFLLLLECHHDQRETKSQRFSRTSKRDTNNVATWESKWWSEYGEIWKHERARSRYSLKLNRSRSDNAFRSQMLQYRLWYFHILFNELGEAKNGADKYIPQSVQLERECLPHLPECDTCRVASGVPVQFYLGYTVEASNWITFNNPNSPESLGQNTIPSGQRLRILDAFCKLHVGH